MNFRLIKILTSCGLFAAITLMMLSLHDHVLYYEDQHNLFLFTRDYACHTIHEQGFMHWLATFVIQFYHIPWLGASIIALLFVAIYLLAEFIIKKLTGLRDFLQLGVIAAIALYPPLNKVDSTPAVPIEVLLILAAVSVILLFSPSLPWAKKSIPDSQKIKPLYFCIPLILSVIYIGFLYGKASKETNFHERAMILVEKATREKDWDKVISMSDEYLNVQPNNKLIIYLRCLALANQGILLEKLFDYPMTQGVDAIIFPWMRDNRAAEYGNLIHEYTGSLNDATHWAFECLTVGGETANNLRNLAKYNIALGKPKVAQQFVNKLKHSLFYRKDAASLQRQILGQEPPEVHYAFANDSIGSSRLIDFSPIRNLQQILEVDPDNKIALQYFLASLLLANDQDALVDNLKPGKTYSSLIEQALLIYTLYPDAKPLDQLGLSVSQKCRDAYARYSDLVRTKQTMLEKQLYGNTFWYYIGRVCPTGLRKQSTLKITQKLPDNILNH